MVVLGGNLISSDRGFVPCAASVFTASRLVIATRPRLVLANAGPSPTCDVSLPSRAEPHQARTRRRPSSPRRGCLAARQQRAEPHRRLLTPGRRHEPPVSLPGTKASTFFFPPPRRSCLKTGPVPCCTTRRDVTSPPRPRPRPRLRTPRAVRLRRAATATNDLVAIARRHTAAATGTALTTTPRTR